MTFVSYAQNFEDVMLWRALRHVPAGFYIDVGAFHPDEDSVTRAFSDNGWHGINVEPNAEACRIIAAARPRDVTLNVAVGRAPGRAAFHVAQDGAGGLSSLDEAAVARIESVGAGHRTVEVAVETLAAICAAHAPADIHFLKIDVEGGERAVLEGADFTRWRPWIVVAEATAPMSTVEVHAAWEELLTGSGYRFAWFDGLNRFYVAEERYEALAPQLRAPPNVFDDFIRRNDAAIAAQVQRAQDRLREVVGMNERLVVQLSHQEAAAEGLRRELAAAGETGAALRARADLADRAVADAAAAGAALRAELAAARAEADAARARAEAALAGERGARRVAEEGRAGAEAMLAAMRRSTSWRVSAPVRWLRGGR